MPPPPTPEDSPLPPFTQQPIPGRGLGLIATRPLPRGTLLLAEPPLLTLPPSPSNSTILSALASHPRPAQCAFFGLANAHRETLLPARGIWETNFLLLAPGVAGVFLTGSRFNSSCTPNVARAWDAVRGEMVFRALRDVAPAEELCFNYADVLAPRAERARVLSSEFGFTCSCEACCLEGEEGEESDRRRTGVLRLVEEVGRCAGEPTLGMRKIKLALRMLADEHLVHYAASFCYDAFQLCVLVADYTHAKAWVRRAWEVSCVTSGADSTAARMFKLYWANPRSHPLAGRLPAATLSGPD